MAEYIKKQELLNDTKVYKDDSGTVRARKLVFSSYIESLPPAGVVEKEKIDKAMAEIEQYGAEEQECGDQKIANAILDVLEILKRNIGE